MDKITFVIFKIAALLCITFSSYSQRTLKEIEAKLHGGSQKQWVQVENIISMGNQCDTGQSFIFSKKGKNVQRKICQNKHYLKPQILAWDISQDHQGDFILSLNKSEKYWITFASYDFTPNDKSDRKEPCLVLVPYDFVNKMDSRINMIFREQ